MGDGPGPFAILERTAEEPFLLVTRPAHAMNGCAPHYGGVRTETRAHLPHTCHPKFLGARERRSADSQSLVTAHSRATTPMVLASALSSGSILDQRKIVEIDNGRRRVMQAFGV